MEKERNICPRCKSKWVEMDRGLCPVCRTRLAVFYAQNECSSCGKAIEGDEYLGSEITALIQSSQRMRAIVESAKNARLGVQCYHCWSWVCKECSKKPSRKLRFLEGAINPNPIICPKCDKAFSSHGGGWVVPKGSIPLALQDTFAGELNENEHLILGYESTEKVEVVLTDQRFLCGTGQPLPEIFLKDIDSIDIVWTEDTEFVMFFALKGNRKSTYWRLSQLRRNVAGLEREDLPRLICDTGKIPFAPPKIIPPNEFGGRPKGTIVKFYPKKDIEWPDRCPSCMTPISKTTVNRAILHLEQIDMFRNASLGNIKPRPPDLNIEYRVPYCEQCYNRKSLLSPKAVKDFGIRDYSVLLEFENDEYAKLFVEKNSKPLDSCNVERRD